MVLLIVSAVGAVISSHCYLKPEIMPTLRLFLPIQVTVVLKVLI